jgi:sigma-B regulation protein RsbU (phosphoserine phosphatase)
MDEPWCQAIRSARPPPDDDSIAKRPAVVRNQGGFPRRPSPHGSWTTVTSPDPMSASSPDPLPAGDALDSTILRVLMDTIPDHIYFKDRESRIVRNNIAHAKSLGATSPEACVGKTDRDFFTEEHAGRAFADERRIMETGVPLIGIMERITRLNGTVFWGSATKLPWRDASGQIIGTFGLTRDITNLKHAEDELTDERNLLRTIIDHLPSRVFVKDADCRFVLNNRAHLDSLGVKSQQEALGRRTVDFFPGARGQQARADDLQVLAGGPPIVSSEKSDLGAEGNVHWSLTTKVPLRDAAGQITGLVGISHDITRRKLAEETLRRTAAEMEADVRMACRVQQAFLPSANPVFPRGASPEATTLRFAHRYVPATTLAGDFVHIQPLSDTRCGVLICDVMGHGVRAGLLTALIRGVVEELEQRASDPAHVIAEINRELTPLMEQTGEVVFATAIFAVIDTAAGTLAYANAGHPWPLVRRGASAVVEALANPNPEPAAGLVGNFAYTSATTTFAPGDCLLLYTDGLVEASNPAGEMYGEARLQALVGQRRAESGADLIDGLIGDIRAFSGRNEFEDDICAVAIESTGKPGAGPAAQPRK